MSFAINYNYSIYSWLKKKVDPSDVVLDFGAGFGEYCNRFYNDGYLKIQAVEIDESMYAKYMCPVQKALCFEDDKFDLIYSCNVLEHIDNEQEIVDALVTKLKKEGKIKFFVPAKQILFSEMDVRVGHFRRYEKQDLIYILHAAGLDITRCYYYDFLGFFATLLYKIIGSNGTIDKRTLIIYDKLFFPLSRFLDIVTFGKIIGKNLIIEGKKIS